MKKLEAIIKPFKLDDVKDAAKTGKIGDGDAMHAILYAHAACESLRSLRLSWRTWARRRRRLLAENPIVDDRDA